MASRPALDAARLWTGGLSTALVAALTAVAGILLTRRASGASVLVPRSVGLWGDRTTGWYAVGGALAGLAATGLMHLLIAVNPRPIRCFARLVVPATAVAMLAPLATTGTPHSAVVTAVLNLVLGLVVGSSVAGSARGAMNAAARADGVCRAPTAHTTAHSTSAVE